jgi:hypothetical protein
MKKNLLIGTAALISSLIAIPAAFADQGFPSNQTIQLSHWDNYSHSHSSGKIHYLKAKLERAQAERQRAEWAYHQARRIGDWGTARFEKNRLYRLDQEIRQTRYELSRAYEQKRPYRYDDWRREYSYR